MKHTLAVLAACILAVSIGTLSPALQTAASEPRPPELVIRIQTTGYTSTEMQWIVEELSYNIAELTNWKPKKGLILDKLHDTGRVIGEWETR